MNFCKNCDEHITFFIGLVADYWAHTDTGLQSCDPDKPVGSPTNPAYRFASPNLEPVEWKPE